MRRLLACLFTVVFLMAAPIMVQAAGDPALFDVTVTWDNTANPTATGYRVDFRVQGSGSAFTLLDNTLPASSNSYVDVDRGPGSFCYLVRALRGAEVGPGGAADEVCVTVSTVPLVLVPGVTAAETGP